MVDVSGLAIVADDLTGAMDAGVQVAKRGLHTLLLLCEEDLRIADAVVLSTDSRDVSASEAYSLSRLTAQRVRNRAVYKKIDSTLRGNIGAELDGMLDGLGLKHALVAPAFPAAGRLTIDGYHWVNGLPLAQSAFGRDPRWPAAESHVPTLLAAQTRRCVGHLSLAVVERGARAVASVLRARGAEIVVADVAEAAHLATLAQAVVGLTERWLLCGSAGLAAEWPLALGLGGARALLLNWKPTARPVLVLAGSLNPVTARQLRLAAEGGYLRLVGVTPSTGCWNSPQAEALSALNQGQCVTLTTTFSPYLAGKSNQAAEMLAEAAKWLLGRAVVSGVLVTGGHVAQELCRSLGAHALHILDEVQPGVPAGAMVGGPYDGLRLVTKAGGLGSDEAIIQGIQHVQAGLHE